MWRIIRRKSFMIANDYSGRRNRIRSTVWVEDGINSAFAHDFRKCWPISKVLTLLNLDNVSPQNPECFCQPLRNKQIANSKKHSGCCTLRTTSFNSLKVVLLAVSESNSPDTCRPRNQDKRSLLSPWSAEAGDVGRFAWHVRHRRHLQQGTGRETMDSLNKQRLCRWRLPICAPRPTFHNSNLVEYSGHGDAIQINVWYTEAVNCEQTFDERVG